MHTVHHAVKTLAAAHKITALIINIAIIIKLKAAAVTVQQKNGLSTCMKRSLNKKKTSQKHVYVHDNTLKHHCDNCDTLTPRRGFGVKWWPQCNSLLSSSSNNIIHLYPAWLVCLRVSPDASLTSHKSIHHRIQFSSRFVLSTLLPDISWKRTSWVRHAATSAGGIATKTLFTEAVSYTGLSSHGKITYTVWLK